MKNFFQTFYILTLFVLLSLKANSFELINDRNWEILRGLKNQKAVIDANLVYLRKESGDDEILNEEDKLKKIEVEIKHAEEKIQSFKNHNEYVIENNSDELWRLEKESIKLRALHLYELKRSEAGEEKLNLPEFSISTFGAISTSVSIEHTFFSGVNGEFYFQDNVKPFIDVEMVCNTPVMVNGFFGKKVLSEGRKFKFKLGDSKLSNESFVLEVNPNFNKCTFIFKNSREDGSKIYGFKIVNEKEKLRSLNTILNTTEICTLKNNQENMISEMSIFETNGFLNMTCPRKYSRIVKMPEPEDTLLERARILLGQDLPKDFIKNGNPYAELDFSKAPEFDVIFITALVYRADFFGTILTRMLAYHADKGTLVRVLNSDAILGNKDKMLYERTMAKHPNIKFVHYGFDTEYKGGSWISSFHRTNHVKIFAAYSLSSPEKSVAILGGRNVHDGFVFKAPPDVSKYPEVKNYSNDGGPWAYWQDFEIAIYGQSFVESITRHFFNLYHADKRNFVTRVPSLSVLKDDALESEKEKLRHYISIPFKDEPGIDDFYVKLIDSAKERILISSPYFRPLGKVGQAFDRAISRGVKIELITRFKLDGDDADFILGEVNKDGSNKYYKRINIYDFNIPRVILHSKLILIDGKISFVSSVNLNKRSFYHDLENGVLINDPVFTAEMEQVYSEYLKNSTLVNDEKKIIFWKKWLISLLDGVF